MHSPETPTAPVRGTFRLRIRPDGMLIAPDLAEPLLPVLRRAGADESHWKHEPCAVKTPALSSTRRRRIGVELADLSALSSNELWQIHRIATEPTDLHETGATLLDVKIELARRLLSPCELCERRCRVDRLAGETGFCELGAGVQLRACANLYNEGPLIGAPTFGVFVGGCSLRCSFCYRPGELKARGQPECSAIELADILDQAAESDSKSWHFLGGNPDESLPGILQALALTRHVLPVVWNSALMLSPPALRLLDQVVDIWLPDFKFGNDTCAFEVAGISHYTEKVQRNLAQLQGQRYVVVRHMEMPGHEHCCTQVVESYLREKGNHFLTHRFPMFPPPKT